MVKKTKTTIVKPCKLHRRPIVQAVAMALAMQVGNAGAASIFVDSNADDLFGCTLRNAITSANTDMMTGSCVAGDGPDIIDLSLIAGQTIALSGSQLPNVNSGITL